MHIVEANMAKKSTQFRVLFSNSSAKGREMHPLVAQLCFARSEFVRCLQGLTAEDARKRVEPMNAISWNIGHLASQEQFLWVYLAQGRGLYPDLHKQVGYGSPASTPPLEEMWTVWRNITEAADVYLDTVTTDVLQGFFTLNGQEMEESIGTLMLRNIYHYWYHNGENAGIRQALGHENLPQFVGNMTEAAYRPDQQ
jgi:hypothetical protein